MPMRELLFYPMARGSNLVTAGAELCALSNYLKRWFDPPAADTTNGEGSSSPFVTSASSVQALSLSKDGPLWIDGFEIYSKPLARILQTFGLFARIESSQKWAYSLQSWLYFSQTTLPPMMVSTGWIFTRSETSTAKGSLSSRTRSASFPVFMVPFWL